MSEDDPRPPARDDPERPADGAEAAGDAPVAGPAPGAGDPAALGTPRQRVAILAAALLLLAAGIVVALASSAGGGEEERTSFARGAVPARQVEQLRPAAARAGCTARSFPSEGEVESADTVTYRSDPPHSGDHHPEPALDRAYYASAPPTEQLVHSLYHGRVLLWFDPQLSEREKGNLKALFDEDRNHVILVPRASMDVPVAATAWTKRLTCPRLTSATYDALRAFRDAHRDRAPEFQP